MRARGRDEEREGGGRKGVPVVVKVGDGFWSGKSKCSRNSEKDIRDWEESAGREKRVRVREGRRDRECRKGEERERSESKEGGK